MKQKSVNVLKNKIITLKLKKYHNISYLYNILRKNKNDIKKKIIFIKVNNSKKYWNNEKILKICHFRGNFNSVNKKLKLSRTSINNFIIDNTLSFYKKISNNFKYSTFFFKKF